MGQEMAEPDNIARFLGVLGILIAAAGLVISFLAYRRGSPKVKARLRITDLLPPDGIGPLSKSIKVEAVILNSGGAGVYTRNLALKWRGTSRKLKRPELWENVQAEFSTMRIAVPAFDTVSQQLLVHVKHPRFSLSMFDDIQVRLIVDLSNGKTAVSKYTSVMGYDHLSGR